MDGAERAAEDAKMREGTGAAIAPSTDEHIARSHTQAIFLRLCLRALEPHSFATRSLAAWLGPPRGHAHSHALTSTAGIDHCHFSELGKIFTLRAS